MVGPTALDFSLMFLQTPSHRHDPDSRLPCLRPSGLLQGVELLYQG